MIIQVVPISDTKHRVVAQCFTMDTLEGWISVDSIPAPPQTTPPKGKAYELYYNPQTSELWHELVDYPLDDSDRISMTEQTLADLVELLIEKGVLIG